jgi:hypothetical protein
VLFVYCTTAFFVFLKTINPSIMSYFVVSISNGGGAPEQAYRKMQSAGACPERPYAGKFGMKRKMKMKMKF